MTEVKKDMAARLAWTLLGLHVMACAAAVTFTWMHGGSQ